MVDKFCLIVIFKTKRGNMPYKDSEKYRQWWENNKERLKQKRKEYAEQNKERLKEYHQNYGKNYRLKNKEKIKNWNKENHEHIKEYGREYYKNNKEYVYDYMYSDTNSLGQTKHSIRGKSQYYLRKYGKPIEGYEIHHCFTYNEPYKFIYCPRKLHRLIHSYLKQHNIDADTEHYEYIKHLLDDTVIKYNIE